MENEARSFPCFAHNIVIYACLAAGQGPSSPGAGLGKYSIYKGDIQQIFPYISKSGSHQRLNRH